MLNQCWYEVGPASQTLVQRLVPSGNARDAPEMQTVDRMEN